VHVSTREEVAAGPNGLTVTVPVDLRAWLPAVRG
jgi:hypothetical protein